MSGWLAGLDAFVVGLAYLFALLATRFVVRPLLVSVLGSAPFVGGWLAGNVDGGISAFERTITPAANASMGTIVSALDWLTAQGRALLGDLGELADGVYAGLYNLATVTIPHAAFQVLLQAEALAGGARDYAWGLLQTAEHDIQSSFGQAEAEAQALTSAVQRDLESEVMAAERTVLLEIRKAEQTAGSLFTQAEHDAGLLVAASESKLAELVAQARADLSGAVGAVEHDLQALAKAERVLIEDTTSVLGGDIAAAEARANQAISALDANLQKSIEGILSGLPWQSLAAAVNTGEAVLQADVRTLVGLGATEIRKALGDAESIRARYAPQVRAALAQIKAG